jgi:Kef-type K+ transport system membrane component KefB
MAVFPIKVRRALLFPIVLAISTCQGFQYSKSSSLISVPTSRISPLIRRLEPLRLTPDAFHATFDLLSFSPPMEFNLPFQDMGRQLSESLDIGINFGQNAESAVPEEATRLVLGSLGGDILIFLAASVIVTTLANALKVTPILGYLIIGAILGPNGLDIFSNAQAGVELGDFGILFLLFSEGLEVTTGRLKKLANYLPLGMAQISLTTGCITAALLLLGRYTPMTTGLLNINDPVQACILAITCALSTSAFIFPVLKERGWEEEQSGAAATTILLLQDLLVAPLLVVLPILVSSGPTDFAAIGFLTAKATIGFGSVIFAGSFFLSALFRLVSQTRSSETFVALCLLVSAGMGEIAQTLGLTETAGAFAAGVLLANTNYRAQIQADILPFKGILLGIFFMDAGSNFDLNLVMQEWPTVLIGAGALIVIKALTLAVATQVPREIEPNRLPTVDAIRISILLAGGGEFAFVVLALADKIGMVSDYLLGLLTAIVLVTMGVTPILGDLAETLSKPFASTDDTSTALASSDSEAVEMTFVAEDSIVVLGHSEIGRAVLRVLGDQQPARNFTGAQIPNIVAFSRNPDLVDTILTPSPGTIVLYGDGTNPEVIRSSGITEPKAIFVAYQEHARVVSATARLRAAFPDTPIYARAAKRRESRDLQLAGATEIVVECDELARSVPQLMRGAWEGPLEDSDYDTVEAYRVAASAAAQLPLTVVDDLFELYESLDLCATGLIGRQDIIEMFRKTKKGFIASDQDIKQMERWLRSSTAAHMDPLDRVEFCRLYARAPDFVKESFGLLRDVK